MDETMQATTERVAAAGAALGRLSSGLNIHQLPKSISTLFENVEDVFFFVLSSLSALSLSLSLSLTLALFVSIQFSLSRSLYYLTLYSLSLSLSLTLCSLSLSLTFSLSLSIYISIDLSFSFWEETSQAGKKIAKSFQWNVAMVSLLHEDLIDFEEIKKLIKLAEGIDVNPEIMKWANNMLGDRS